MNILLPGLLLTAIAWLAAWGRFGVITEFSFFPLWLGYILVLNGMSEVLFQHSIIRRMGLSFLGLFALSIPMWWFFELMNSFVHNWHYIFAHPISDLQYRIQASIDFSTVAPAALSAGYFFHQLLPQRSPLARCTPVQMQHSYLFLSVLIGIAAFSIIPVFPNETFSLVWIAPLLLLEPVAYVMGAPCFLRFLEKGRCQPAVSIMVATLFTGFWWEMWNYYSLPKWIYTIPYVGFWKIFEMPLLGYLGYPFFGLIDFTYTGLLSSILLKQDMADVFNRPHDGLTLDHNEENRIRTGP
jgi:hypothetical protein